MKLAMVRRLAVDLIMLLVLVDAVLSAVPAITKVEQEEEFSSSMAQPAKTKKKKKQGRSTSSSSGDRQSDDGNDNTLSDSTDSTSSSSSTNKDNSHVPKSTEERHGWRKWHRKCTRCPEDAKKKWKDPSIEWICGAYQRARRTFKSTCMMNYRNCQDGTMFVKIKSRRCPNETGQEVDFHGDHWFYEYKAKLSGESSDSKKSYSSISSPGSDTNSDSSD